MVHPIYVYGTEALRQETEPVEENSDALQALIDDMIETMYAASGIGLAAPQIGRSERVFVVDASPMADEAAEEGEPLPPQPMAFINPEIVWESEAACELEEGCLSIPDVREMVMRPERVAIRYRDRDFNEQEIEVGSVLARVIQHEYDHLDGILFLDHLSAFRKRLLKRTLKRMARGDVETDYSLATRNAEAHAS